MTDQHPYDPQCPHCIPALINVKTGEVYPEDHPLMVKILKYWHTTPFAQRAAFIAVTVDSSTDPSDQRNAQPIVDAMAALMRQATSN